MKVYTNNVVSIGGTFVGRLHKDDVHNDQQRRWLRFYLNNSDVEHRIPGPLYIGRLTSWKINPIVKEAIKEISKKD